MQVVAQIELVAGQGIQGEPRYFGRLSQSTGQPSRRQLSLIEREQIAEHATTLGCDVFVPGAVRSNIETTGVQLVPLVGRELQLGTAVIHVFAPRDPCAKMDSLCAGLRALMLPSKQGVMAEVVKPGIVRVGDAVTLLAPAVPA